MTGPRLSIRLRLAAVFTLAAVILLSVGGFLYLRQLRANLQYSLDRSLTLQATSIAFGITGGRSAQLPRRIDNYAQILTPTGRVLRSSAALHGDHLLDAHDVQFAAAGGTVRANRSVELHDPEDVDLEPMRVYAVQAGRTGTVIAVAARRDLIDDPVQSSTELLLILGLILIIVVGPASWLFARAALRPVERMRAQVASLDPADTSGGVPVPRSGDEIARLGETFNELLGRVNAALARERAFVADAGHELRTPLTVLKGEFELAQRAGRSRDALLDTVGIAADETERLIRLTEKLLGLAREGAARQRPVDVADVAHAAAAVSGAEARGVSVDVQDETGGVVHGDADRLRQAIDNLLTNAEVGS